MSMLNGGQLHQSLEEVCAMGSMHTNPWQHRTGASWEWARMLIIDVLPFIDFTYDYNIIYNEPPFWSMWALNYSSVAMETRKTSRDWMVRCQERSTMRKRESDNEEAVLHQLEVSCQEQEAPHYRKSHSTTLNDTLEKVWDEDCTSYDRIIICACDNEELSSDCTLSMICTKGWRIDAAYDKVKHHSSSLIWLWDGKQAAPGVSLHSLIPISQGIEAESEYIYSYILYICAIIM